MNNTDHSVRWPACGGENAELIRNLGPQSTPLGPPERWSRALRNAVDLILRSHSQISLLWGPQYVALYNDAFSKTIGNKHPANLGRPAREQAPELWDELLPSFEKVWRGETVSGRDVPFVSNRHGPPEQQFFDFSWSPVLDDDGEVGGLLIIVTETTERVRATRALAASERRAREKGEQLQMAQAAGGIGVFSHDLESDTLSASSEFCKIFGLPVQEAVPAAMVESLHISHNAGMPRRESHADSASPLEMEYPIRRANDGALRWISHRAELVFETTGKPVLLRGAVQDITLRKHVEATLRQSEARFEALARQMPNLVWTATADGRLDWVSESMSAYTGVGHAELLGDGWAKVIHPDDVERAHRVWAQALATGAPYINEGRLRRHDGAWRWYLARAESVQGRGDVEASPRWVGINIDIHDQKVAQERLARSVVERTLQRDHLWQLSADIMLMADFSGRITAVNPAWQDMLGWSKARLVGSAFETLLHPEDVAFTLAEFDRLQRGQKQMRIENRVLHEDGSYRIVAWAGVCGTRFIQAVGRDMTALRESEARLRQSQKMEAIGQLTGGIAHDFNNLLQGISGPIELMRRRLSDGRFDGLERYVDAAAQSAERAASLIHRLLAFSRRQTLDPQPVNVNALIASMADLLRRTFGERIRLTVEAGADAGAALGDVAQLESAILNLAINARDAMPDGGELRIRTASVVLGEGDTPDLDISPGNFCAIAVTDTGTGMAPDVLAKAFDPFFTTKPIGQGSGLGLSMVYGFAQQSRGFVRMQSAPGEGTAVTLYLPRSHSVDQPPVAHPGSNRHLLQGNGEVVLVVEDDPAVLLFVLDVLAELRYRTMHARDGISALAMLQSTERVDLLVSDVGLPGINGRQLAEIAREQRPAIPIVFMTGYAEQVRTRAEFLAPGMQIIAKPFAIDAFAKLVKEVIRGNAP